MSLTKSSESNNYYLTSNFDLALLLATSLHNGHFRKKTSIPYVSHLLAVASIAMEITDDEEIAIAALLHDAAEDCGGKATLNIIEHKFGTNVANIVEGCSDTLEEKKPPWELRKKEYIEKLSEKSEQVRIVSLADKLHNIRSIYIDYKILGEKLWPRFNVGNKHGTISYYKELVNAYKKAGFNNKKAEIFLEELEKTVNEIELMDLR